MSLAENILPHLPLVYDPMEVYQAPLATTKPSTADGGQSSSGSRAPATPLAPSTARGVDVYA